ncbi:hypothetical protein PhCBS80983_g03287 [Powellomyces hirtus]|uniref:AmmeMemoRadiSam system protein B n=1 Tax=Powellomyces hirtus TaxID=109895 RepID=A0A507E314_9FUNG|nr:hypothetical protein PhCBS80983_g03287 [Powellomyces hirtus]
MSAPLIREATHAGSWYTSSGKALGKELATWLAAVPNPLPETDTPLPIGTCRAIIAPHAGYAYSGPTAAWAYQCVDPEQIERVFILGPSHHYYLSGCALSPCSVYATPLGNLTLDTEVMAALEATGKFETMTKDQDEDEHSIEMHLPYVYHIMASTQRTPKIVPILIGSLTPSLETTYGALLAPYLRSPSTLFVVSSDFCHYGSRFSFTSLPAAAGTTTTHSDNMPIYKRIEALDREGMRWVEKLDHKAFTKYLKQTRNTICGRHPIGVLLCAVQAIKEEEKGNVDPEFKFTKYAQSSHVESPRDSSVSYASGYLTL